MDYFLIHKNTYDELASEYEGRANSLLAVTTEAMNYFSSHIKSSGAVLDIGCGVGIAINILTAKGFQATGIEISSKMAGFAKNINPDADIIVGNFLKTDFSQKFDAVLAFAFIHLFPKNELPKIMAKIKSVLNDGGVALLSSTQSDTSREGWEIKKDFKKEQKRFRKHWTEAELLETVEAAGFKKLALKKFEDPFGKIWMDFVVRKA